MHDALLTHCSEHVPDAMHVRTDGRTNADPSKTESGSCVGNAHEPQARIYIVEWEHYHFVKVGVTRGDRFQTFTGRGGVLRSLTNPMPLSVAHGMEAALHRDMRSAGWPQQFTCKEAAIPFLGHGGAGWTECYRMGEPGSHRDALRQRKAAG